MNTNTDMDGIFDGSIADGLTDKWSNEEKRRFMEDWLNDSFLSDEFMEGSAEHDHEEFNRQTRKTITRNVFDSESQKKSTELNDHATTSSISNKQNVIIVDDSTDADSDVYIRRQRKGKTVLDSESQDNDSEINPNATVSENPDDDTEEIISTQRKKRKRETFFDSESQGNDSDVYQGAAASSVCENSEISNGEDSQSVDSQPKNDSSEIEQSDKTLVPSIRPRTEKEDMSHDVDDKIDEDSTGRKKMKTETIFDSESQGNDSEVSQDAETSSAYKNSEISTAEDLPGVIILDSQSSQDDSSELEQPYIPYITFGSPMRTRSSGVDRLRDQAETSGRKAYTYERNDDDDDDDYVEDVDDENSTNSDQCYPKRHLEKEFTTYLQYMLSYCLDPEFLDGANSQDDLKIAKDKIERKIQDLENMLKSEAWQTGFVEAMKTFPILQCETLYPHEGCEACARPGRIASKRLTFTGPPYDIKNFESQETSLPSHMSFEVGRYCAKRSKLYHRVFHYRFHIRDKCVEAVNQFSENDVTAEFVLNKCMDDEKWRKEKYRDFCSLIDNVTIWFAAINKSANRKS